MSQINMFMRTHTSQNGITLLITLLLMGVLLGISATLLNITLKQYRLSSIAHESEVAFQAANAGVECILYHDYTVKPSPFEVTGMNDPGGDDPGRSRVENLECMGDLSNDERGGNDDCDTCDSDDLVESGEEQLFRFDWVNENICTEVSVYKFYLPEDNLGDLPAEDLPVMIDGQEMRPDCPEGAQCTVVKSRGYNVSCGDIGTGGRVVEREYTQVY